MSPNLKSLSPMDFTKMIPSREQRIAEAPAKALPELKSYNANVLAMSLHPKAQKLYVKEVRQFSKDVCTFVLAIDKEAYEGTAPEKPAYFSAGQYICLILEINGKTITRPYSLSSSPKESTEGYYMLTIKRTEGGLVSNYILDEWTVGTKVTASAPLGAFKYEPLRDAKTIIGLAGGSGITPFRSLAKAIADGDEDCSLVLLYGTRTLEDAVFEEEFKAIAASTDRFKLVNVISEGQGEAADGIEYGFITADLIKKYAPEGEYSIFLCGPQAMYEFADKEIAKLGIRRKFVRHELFGEYRHPEKNGDFPAERVGSYDLTVIQDGVSTTIRCTTDSSLLVAMEKEGIAAPARCRSGICGFCHSKLVSGEVYVPKNVDGRRLADLQYGYIHPCATFPLSDLVIEVPKFK